MDIRKNHTYFVVAYNIVYFANALNCIFYVDFLYSCAGIFRHLNSPLSELYRFAFLKINDDLN